MSRNNDVKTVVKLRRSRTGESSNTLTPVIRAAVDGLSRIERAALVEALCRPGKARVSREVQDLVLPSAVSTAQRELEAAVFEALLRSMAGLEPDRTAWSGRLGDLVRKVVPDRNWLMLSLNPVALAPLLCELLPVDVTEDGVQGLHGVCGLRAQLLLPDRLELYLVDRRQQARIMLSGVSEERLNEAWAYVDLEHPRARQLRIGYPDTLSPVERRMSLRSRQVRLCAALASALLRRIRLFADVWWIKATGRDSHEIVVEWPEGPLQEDILAGLCHPVVGITHDIREKASWPDLRLARLRSPEGEILFRSMPMASRLERREIASAWTVGRRPSFEEVVARRCEYTGEDQRRVERLLRGKRIRRQDVLPDADTAAQRYLETSLLLAIRDSAPRIGPGPYTGHQVFAAVSPRSGSLTVDLVDGVAVRFFRALLAPMHPTDDRPGLPGLRIRPAEDRLHLGLLNSDACVTVRGIGASAWKQIWAEIKDTEHNGRCVDPLLRRSPVLSEGERHALEFRERHCQIALGSAMLRRIGLLTSSFALDVWLGGGGYDIQLEIHDGPPIPSVAKMLSDPLFGIVGGPVALSSVDDSFAKFVDTDPARFAGTTRTLLDPHALVLRRLGRGDYDPQTAKPES